MKRSQSTCWSTVIDKVKIDFSLVEMHLGTYDRTLICDPKDPNFILKFNSEKVSENYTLYSPNTSKFEATALQFVYSFNNLFQVSTITKVKSNFK